MSSLPPVQPPSTIRRIFAIGLSVVTLKCALLYWLGYAFVTAQIYAGVYGGPELLIAVTFVTLPPALLCTVVALILVGWRRCKLAWISLSLFAWPYIALLFCVLYAAVFRRN